MRIAVACLTLFASALWGAETLTSNQGSSVVKSVEIRGGSTSIALATKVGEPVDSKSLRKDVQTLWTTGLFSDIQVKTTRDDSGTAVIFDVSPKPQLILHDFRIEPNSYGLNPPVQRGAPIDDVQAIRAAGQIRQRLNEKGYINAAVEPELTPIGKNKADLIMHVTAGSSVQIKDVDFIGQPVFSQKEIMRAMRAVRATRVLPTIPGVFKGWVIRPAYNEGAIDSDLARLQSFYIERGYFDARVSLENKDVEGENAHLRFFVKAGPHYSVNRIAVSGIGPEPTVWKPKDGEFQASSLCSCLMKARREAEKDGVVDFSARFNLHPVDAVEGEPEHAEGERPVVDLASEAQLGKPYRINRIELEGLHHYSEASVRRNLLLDEGDILDSTLLRKSIARLNRAQIFEPIDETQVSVNTNISTGAADIVIPLRERRRGLWNLSGPVGPVSFAGPVQFMLASRLPDWGKNMFELSTYFVSLSLIGYFGPIPKLIPLGLSKQGILPVISLFRPFSPGEGWRSGLMIAPQLGWQATAYTYGATQITSRIVPILQGEQRFIPRLSVTFERPNGDAVLLCDPPKPRYYVARTSAAVLLQFLGSAPLF